MSSYYLFAKYADGRYGFIGSFRRPPLKQAKEIFEEGEAVLVWIEYLLHSTANSRWMEHGDNSNVLWSSDAPMFIHPQTDEDFALAAQMI